MSRFPNFGLDASAVLEALSRSQAIIEFAPDGTVLTANELFLESVGYALAETVGKHHSMFVDPAYARSEEYKSFWARLAEGGFERGEYKRFGKGGKEIWLQASYNPVLGQSGKVQRVVACATAPARKTRERAG